MGFGRRPLLVAILVLVIVGLVAFWSRGTDPTPLVPQGSDHFSQISTCTVDRAGVIHASGTTDNDSYEGKTFHVAVRLGLVGEPWIESVPFAVPHLGFHDTASWNVHSTEGGHHGSPTGAVTK